VWQLANTLVPYAVLWGLMVWSLQVSYAITLVLAVLAAGFLVRIFVIFHDCCHGSFFASKRANRVCEYITGVLAFSPYRQWRHLHARHHATAADLDRRGAGDVWTLTIQEYLKASRWKRLAYRVARNPIVLFLVTPTCLFLVGYRFPSRHVGKSQRRGVYWTNAALLGIVLLMSVTIGVRAYLMIQLPVIILAGAAGVWLFYVQHQFEGVYWERRGEWDFEKAALQGSSFYQLPRVLQWLTGNIGFHHVHHLSPTIPNYNLERCHREEPLFQNVEPVTLGSSLRALSFRLWDEQRRRLVGYDRLRAVRGRTPAAP
jgi:omega-6 fatty acid desaturase (delta-12 desaturase)